jgi:hypothetical protein
MLRSWNSIADPRHPYRTARCWPHRQRERRGDAPEHLDAAASVWRPRDVLLIDEFVTFLGRRLASPPRMGDIAGVESR